MTPPYLDVSLPPPASFILSFPLVFLHIRVPHHGLILHAWPAKPPIVPRHVCFLTPLTVLRPVLQH